MYTFPNLTKTAIVISLFTVVILLMPRAGYAQVDLSLSVTASADTVGIFKFFSIQVKVENQGDEVATGVSVLIPQNIDTAVFEGGNEVLPVGTFFDPLTGIWTIGSINPGEEVWVQVNFFSKKLCDAPFYAQVWTCNQDDVDSAPQNGTPFVPNQDDEGLAIVVIVANYCNLTPSIYSAVCNDLGTPNSPNDDVILMSMLVNSNLNFSGNWLGCSVPLVYNQDGTVVCNGNPANAAFDVVGAIALNSQDWAGQMMYIGPAFNNSVFSTCNTTITIPAPCIEQDTIIEELLPDLQLKIRLSDSAVHVGSGFLMHAYIRNVGDAAATNIKVAITLPQGVAFRYNKTGPFVLDSLVSSYDTTSNIWTIPYLPAGDSTRVRLRLYRTDFDSMTFYGQVIEMSETDHDSDPNNGACCTSNEDDEGIDGMSATLISGTEEILPDWFGVYPNPVAQSLYINTRGHAVNSFTVFDIIGRELLKLPGQTSEVDVSNFAAGQYVLVARKADGRVSVARFQVAR